MYRVTIQSDVWGYDQFDFKSRKAAKNKLDRLVEQSLNSKELREKADQFTIYKY